MERFVKGDVVVTPFPFSDLTSSIKRPAVVVATLKGDDLILCQITTKERDDSHVISLTSKDFTEGGLKLDSFIRPTRLFTLSKSIIKYKAGSLSKEKIGKVVTEICEVLQKD